MVNLDFRLNEGPPGFPWAIIMPVKEGDGRGEMKRIESWARLVDPRGRIAIAFPGF